LQEVKFTTDDKAKQVPPFRVTFPSAESKEKKLLVEPYAHTVAVGPYPEDKPKANPIRFTAVQGTTFFFLFEYASNNNLHF